MYIDGHFYSIILFYILQGGRIIANSLLVINLLNNYQRENRKIERRKDRIKIFQFSLRIYHCRSLYAQLSYPLSNLLKQKIKIDKFLNVYWMCGTNEIVKWSILGHCADAVRYTAVVSVGFPN